MAIRTKEELMTAIRDRVGDDTSDEVISIIEDLSDTLDDYDARIADSGDWKARYEQNDAEWRKKYRDRFFNGSRDDDPDDNPEETEGNEVLTFEELFKEGE